MSQPLPLTLETTVDEAMRRCPALIRLFLDFKMRCVGCPIGRFHTIEEACQDHAVSAEDFMAAVDATAVRNNRSSF
jgi:hybrid cluster-associated redox disulfide protein